MEKLRRLDGEAEGGMEIEQLREREDVKTGVRKGLNGALKRLREAGKVRWRAMRVTLAPGNCDEVAREMRAEADKWAARSRAWLFDAFGPLGRTRHKLWRVEMEWRGISAHTIARDYRERAAEADAYKRRVDEFAKVVELAEDEAQSRMIAAEEKELEALARELEQDWRWDAHKIQLEKRGALTGKQIVEQLKIKGRNSPVWYTAVSEALKTADGEMPEVRGLRAGLEARKQVMDELDAREKEIKAETKEHIENAKVTKMKHTALPKAPSEAAVPPRSEQKAGKKVNDRAKRNVGKAIDMTVKGVDNEAEAKRLDDEIREREEHNTEDARDVQERRRRRRD